MFTPRFSLTCFALALIACGPELPPSADSDSASGGNFPDTDTDTDGSPTFHDTIVDPPTTGDGEDTVAEGSSSTTGNEPPVMCSPDPTDEPVMNCGVNWADKAIEACLKFGLDCGDLDCSSPCKACKQVEQACLNQNGLPATCNKVEAECLSGLHDSASCFCNLACQPAPGLHENVLEMCVEHGFECVGVPDTTPCEMCQAALAFAPVGVAHEFAADCEAAFSQCTCDLNKPDPDPLCTPQDDELCINMQNLCDLNDLPEPACSKLVEDHCFGDVCLACDSLVKLCDDPICERNMQACYSSEPACVCPNDKPDVL